MAAAAAAGAVGVVVVVVVVIVVAVVVVTVAGLLRLCLQSSIHRIGIPMLVIMGTLNFFFGHGDAEKAGVLHKGYYYYYYFFFFFLGGGG